MKPYFKAALAGALALGLVTSVATFAAAYPSSRASNAVTVKTLAKKGKKTSKLPYTQVIVRSDDRHAWCKLKKGSGGDTRYQGTAGDKGYDVGIATDHRYWGQKVVFSGRTSRNGVLKLRCSLGRYRVTTVEPEGHTIGDRSRHVNVSAKEKPSIKFTFDRTDQSQDTRKPRDKK